MENFVNFDVLKIILYYCGDYLNLRLVSKTFKKIFDELPHEPVKIKNGDMIMGFEKLKLLNRTAEISCYDFLIDEYKNLVEKIIIKKKSKAYGYNGHFIVLSLKNFKNLKCFISSDFYNFINICDCNKLEMLDVQSNTIEQIYEISCLNLKTLLLNGNPLKYLKGIEDLFNLETLDISNTPVNSLEPLKNLLKLKNLFISLTKVTDLDPLKNLRELQFLDISNTRTADVSPLQNLKKLHSVYAMYCDMIIDCNPIDEIGFIGTIFVIAEPQKHQIKNLKKYKLVENKISKSIMLRKYI